MPAATRGRVVVAVLGFLSVLVMSAVVVAPPYTPARGDPAGVAMAAPAGVTVEVASGGQRTPSYRVEVRNDTNATVETTVRQVLPHGTAVRSVTAGGRAATTATGTEVTWQLHLPARGRATLRTALGPAPRLPLAAPACAFVTDGAMAYDCATGVWGLGPGEGPAWWQRPVLIGGLLAALVALVAAGWWWRRGRRRRARPGIGKPVHNSPEAPTMRSAAPPPVAPQPPPTVRTRKPKRAARPGEPAPRRAPATWRVVGFAALLLLGTIAVIIWIGGTQVAAFGPSAQSTTGAWVGRTTSGSVGIGMRESAFEFTVYRLACTPAGRPAQRQCLVTVGLHNISEADQMWYGGMQRAYLPTGTWVSTDETATRAANGGQDIFAHPIPAGGRLLAPLVFTITGATAPTKIELRSAVFSAGVTVIP